MRHEGPERRKTNWERLIGLTAAGLAVISTALIFLDKASGLLLSQTFVTKAYLAERFDERDKLTKAYIRITANRAAEEAIDRYLAMKSGKVRHKRIELEEDEEQ